MSRKMNFNSDKLFHVFKNAWHKWIRPFMIFLSVLIFGVTIKGEWIIIFVHILNQFGYKSESSKNLNDFSSWNIFTLEYYRMENLPMMWISCNSLGFAIWFVVGGFLQWHFYVNQRNQPEKWKCQPNRWLSPEQERDEFFWGCISLMVANTGSAVIACYIANGGYSTVYYNFKDYSLAWTFLQWPMLFFFQDYFTYWAHRMYHTPFLYTRFHKIHHRYKTPTCWSVTAFHPFEIITMQWVLAAPLFFLPVHWITYTAIGIYTYYNAILDHSGVDIKAPWWQFWKPDSIFHDNHHQYSHVNFSFNCYYWDLIHGTYRKTNRIYNEDIYYGYGKPLTEATKEEMQKEIEQRQSENLKAHRKLSNVRLN